MSRKCKKCGNELKESAKFCSKCGSKCEEICESDNKEANASRENRNNLKTIPKKKRGKEIISICCITIVLLVALFSFFDNNGSTVGTDGVIVETDDVTTGAVYNFDLEEGKKIVESALEKCCDMKLSLDEDFEKNPIESTDGVTYVFLNENSLGFPLAIEISVSNGYVGGYCFKTDTSGFNYAGLEIIQKLYCEVANEVTDDNINITEVKEIVKNNATDKDYYRNDSMHIICRSEGNVFFYMFCACTEEYAQMRGTVEMNEEGVLTTNDTVEAEEQPENQSVKNEVDIMDELLCLVGIDTNWYDFGSMNEYEEHMESVMIPWVKKLIEEYDFYGGTTKIKILEDDRNERIYFVEIYDDLNSGNYAGFYVNLNTDEVTFSLTDSNIVIQ